MQAFANYYPCKVKYIWSPARWYQVAPQVGQLKLCYKFYDLNHKLVIKNSVVYYVLVTGPWHCDD